MTDHAKHAIDFRSDTLTRPTPEMRDAIVTAVVGDDCYGEDPTVNDLEHLAAQLVDKEAALYVPSGTMANLLALLCQTRPGDRVLVPESSHIHIGESGGGAAFAGVVFQTVGSPNGVPVRDELESTLATPDDGIPRPSLLTLENTHNILGGLVLPQDAVVNIADLAHRSGTLVHIDGSRIFNASIATGISPAELAAPADSLSFCLSKGLGAPIGSILASSASTIARAKQFRAMLGGAWRQAGLMAAAGIVGLQSGVERLAEDHTNARRLAIGVNEIRRGSVDIGRVHTNIVNVAAWPFGITPDQLVQDLADRGILAANVTGESVRFVTHLDVTGDDVDTALDAFSDIARAAGKGLN